eukprot:TRINITY_DN5334_c0_g1_i4.p1 TRINITY_DN5334_c0_g1~~TRINITY_DN5334_c0_g1_i4.p1  ORF type:complete len:596 (+),score=98.10 TRINITY_DN5334_c0_g1_i4:242-2029(+)
MATSAFKSTTKRSPIASQLPADQSNSGSSNRSGLHRRSRSLSRSSGRYPPPDADYDDLPKGRFVNTVRGSGFPEISLDDLAKELFLAGEDAEKGSEIARGRSGRRVSSVGPGGSSTKVGSTDASQRRGRSVSRSHGNGNLDNNSGSKVVSDGGSRRRRSVSVSRYKCSDSESDMDHSNSLSNFNKLKSSSNGNFQRSTLHKPTASSQQRVLRRSLSQKDLLHSHDGYSSFSSALTDDEAPDTCNKNGFEKTIRAVYSQKKTEHPTGDGEGNGLYEAMRKEVWHAVEEIKTQLEQVMVQTKPALLSNGDCLESKSSDFIQTFADIRNKYTNKLEQSEKRTQDLLAELAVEEQRGREFSKIVRELLPDPKPTVAPEKTSRARKRSNDRNRMSKRLTEEAEKFFEDFISNVEDTDFSSFDGEKSDASSTVGGTSKTKETMLITKTETCENQLGAPSLPVEMDGVILPWLKWEDSNDLSPLSCKSKMEVSMTSRNALLDTPMGRSTSHPTGDPSASSRASWSPDGHDSSSAVSRGNLDSAFAESRYCPSQCATSKTGGSSFDMDDYLNYRLAEDLLFERLRQRKRTESGGLILCGRTLF